MTDLSAAALGLGATALTKAQLQPAINLFDPNDIDVAHGFYPVETTGALGANTAYNTTGFIKVQGGKSYVRMNIPLNPTQAFVVQSGRVCFYDENKVFISGATGAGTSAFTAPTDGYMRMAIPVGNWWDAQIWQTLVAGTTYWPPVQKEPADRAAHFNMATLRQTRMRAANLMLGTVSTQQLIINLIGDSYLHNAARCTTPLTNYLVSKLGDAGGGWCGFGYLTGGTPPWSGGNQPTYLNGNARPATYPTRLYGSPTNTYYSANTADLASITLSASGDAVEQEFPASPTISAIKLHYVATSAGQIRYTLNGGSTWTTLNVGGTAGTTTVATLSLTGLTQPGTLRIEWVSGTATLSGVDLQSNAGGVRVNKLAATGGALSQWRSVDADNWQTSFAALGGYLTVIEDGRNSQVAGTDPTTWDSYLREIINRVRGKTSTYTGMTLAMDVLIYSPPENLTTGNTVAVAAYAQVARRRAHLTRSAHINGQFAFGYSGLTSEYGATGDVPLMNADNIHPDPNKGGTLMVVDLANAIIPLR